MDYVNQIFGRSLRQLTYQDIVDFFQTDRTENDFLEFKSVPSNAKTESLWDGILRCANAFLNSIGGVIVWGAPLERSVPNLTTGKKEKRCRGPLTNVDPDLTKDTLVRKISAGMTPLANGIQVEILEDVGSNRICIIEIKRSNYAPHQTGNAYYMRLDGQTVYAPHHYIEALIKRVTFPNLEGYLKFYPPNFQHETASWGPHYITNVEIWIFNFSPMENEEQLFFSITSNNCKPLDRMITGWQNIKQNRNLGTLVGTDVMSVLMNGHPYTKTIPFEIEPNIDISNGAYFNFILQFGGKKSPLKYSKYSTILKNTPKGNLKYTIQNKIENKFITEFEDVDSLSRADQLKHYGLM